MIRILFTAAVLLSSSLTEARDYELTLVGPSESCPLCDDAAQAEFEAEQAEYRRTFETITAELNQIEDWFDSLGFKSPHFQGADNGPAQILLYDFRKIERSAKNSPLKKAFGEWENEMGHYDPANGMAINLDSVPNAGLDDEARDTLAHELYHGVQYNSVIYQGPKWVVESMATHAGSVWAGTVPKYNWTFGRPLNAPADEYGRWYFFRGLGEDLKSPQKIAYFAELNERDPRDGAVGLIWLDEYLTDKLEPLSEYFPKFIARYAPDKVFFDGATVEKTIKPVMDRTATNRQENAPVRIDPVAGVYADATPEFIGWSAEPEEERVFLNVISIKEPTDADPLRLIVGQDLIDKGADFVEPIFASDGVMKTPYSVKVTNVSQPSVDSIDQRMKIELRTSQVYFQIHACLKLGQSVPIEVLAAASAEQIAKVFGQGSFRLKASAGEIKAGLKYTAPNVPGEVEIWTTVPTLSGGKKKVTVARTNVVSGGCMIRMTAGRGQITYDSESDYSEMKDGQSGNAVYLSLTDFITFGKGQWRPIPPNIKARLLAAMLAQLETGVVIRKGDRSKKVGEWESHAMPKHMAQRFSWANLRDASTPDGEATARSKAQCPPSVSNTPCTKTTIGEKGAPVKVIFQSDGMPVVVKTKGQDIQFAYGSFQIRKPPGW